MLQFVKHFIKENSVEGIACLVGCTPANQAIRWHNVLYLQKCSIYISLWENNSMVQISLYTLSVSLKSLFNAANKVDFKSYGKHSRSCYLNLKDI